MTENFAEKLRYARRKKKLTMLAVSELSGIALPIYKLIENGRIYPDRDKLDALCEVLGIKWPDDGSGGTTEE